MSKLQIIAVIVISVVVVGYGLGMAITRRKLSRYQPSMRDEMRRQEEEKKRGS